MRTHLSCFVAIAILTFAWQPVADAQYPGAMPAVYYDNMPGEVGYAGFLSHSIGSSCGPAGCSGGACGVGETSCSTGGMWEGDLCDSCDGYPAVGQSWLGRSIAGAYPCWLGWELDAGTVFMEREAPGRNTFTIAANPGGQTLFDPGQLYVGWELGPRLQATKQLDCAGNWKANVVYFGIDAWDFQRDVGAFTTTIRGTAVGGPTGTISSRAHLYNAEANVLCDVTQRISVLAGYRWLEIGDRLAMDVNGGAATLNYRALNQLNGFQIGAKGTKLLCWRRLHVNSDVKAGIFHNYGTSQRVETGAGTTAPVASYIDKHAAFVGEIGVDLHWQMYDHVTSYLGYEAMWVDSVALSTNQVQASGVDFGDTSLYHGLRAGVTCRW